MNRNTPPLIFFTLFVAVTFFFTGYITNADDTSMPQLHLNASLYLISDPLQISIDGIDEINLSQYSLRIEHDGSSYVYRGTLASSIDFNAPREGIYTIQLIHTPEDLVVDSTTVSVINPKLVEPLSEEAISNRLITLDKKHYRVGERVTINVNYKTQNFSLRIVTPTTVYRFVGSPGADVYFTPREIGDHEVQFVVGSNLVEKQIFYVSAEDSPPIVGDNYIPYTNIGYEVKNHQGLEQKANVLIRKNGHVVQSSINPHERYDIELSPNDLAIEKVKFNNLKFSNSLNLGLEEVDPQKNMPSSVYAFAINPEKLDFSNGSITLIAPGNKLYKCKDYNFSTQTCYGEHILIATIQKGERITIELTPQDPLFSFQDTTVSCSCLQLQSPAANSGTISCNIYCDAPIDGPGPQALTGFITQVRYVALVTVTDDGATMSSGNHRGVFDHDTTLNNGNDVVVGTSTVTSTQSITLTRSNLNSSGAYAFTSSNCDNWPNNCSNFDTYLSTSINFQAPGKSTKQPQISISLTTLNVTWNYTAAGALSVVLNDPQTDDFVGSRFVEFNYTPISAAASIDNCTLYTNDTTWSAVNTSSSITNGTANYLGHTFSQDGEFVWNVQCVDADSNIEFSPLNYTVIVDTVSPTVLLTSPVQQSTQNSSTITFNYTVSDIAPIASCSLLINGSSVQTDTTITKDTTQTFIYSLAAGSYSWNVQCLDSGANAGQATARNLIVDVVPVVYNGTWYESATANCAGTGNCDISLLQQTDGSANTRAMSAPAGDTITPLLNATTNYMGGQGVYIPSGTDVDFSADFSALSGGTSTYLSWHLYTLHNDNTLSLICEAGDDGSGGQRIQTVGTEVDTCTTATDFTLSGTDRLRLELVLFNDHPSQATTLTHDFDDPLSFVNITQFYTIGELSVDLVSPSSSVVIAQGETYDQICQASCEYGYCLDVDVYAQYNTSSQVWSNISSSGNLILGLSEINPQNIGDLTANPTFSSNATFVINGSQASINNIRCVAQDTLGSFARSPQTQQVSVSDSSAPNVTLSNPANNTYTANTTVFLSYTVSDSSGLTSCSLYINGTLNQTNSSGLNNPGTNGFTLNFIPGSYDFSWTVSCTDTTSLQGNATQTRNVHVDNIAPNITLNYPAPAEIIGYNSINFNWTAYDNRPQNLTCDLYLDGTLEQSSIASVPSTPTNFTVIGLAVGQHNWSVTCQDTAANTNSSLTNTFNISESPPSVTLYDPADNSYENSLTLTLIYNVTDNNGLDQCSLIFDGVVDQTNTTPVINNNLNNFSKVTTQGTHTWTVNCTDTAGFTDQPTAYTVIVDQTPPVVSIVSPNNTVLNNADVPFRFLMTDSISATGICSIFYNTSFFAANNTGIATINNTVTTQTENNLPDGRYSWNASCFDAAQNNGLSTTARFNVSEAPVVVLSAPAPNAFRNGASVNFTFTASDNDGFSNCTLRLLTGPNISDTVNTSPIVNGGSNNIILTSLASGSHTWTVRCIDNGTYTNSAQPSSRFLFIDNGAPNITLNYPVNDTVNSSSVNFNWTADDDQDLTLTCDLYVDGSINLSSVASSAGNPTNRTVYDFGNGIHNWSVTCTDDATNSNSSTTANFTIAVPPSVTLTEPDQGQWFNFLDDITFEYVPTANDVISSCSLYIEGSLNQTDNAVIADAPNLFFVNFTAQDQGNISWNVLCTDASNLTGGAPQDGYFFIDITAPNLTANSPIPNQTINNNNVTFNYTIQDNLASWLICNLTVDGNPEQENVNLTSNNTYLFNQTFPDGNYSWYLGCYDIAGNYNETPTRNFTIFAPPIVTLLTPTNNSLVRFSYTNLSYLAYDGFSIPQCNLTFDGQYNQSSNSIDRYNNNTFQIDSLTEGVHNWSVTCTDTDNNLGSDGLFYFTVDFSAPSIILYNPQNQTNFTQADVVFNFTANDTLDTNVTCNLTIDSSIAYSSIDVLNAQPVEQTVLNISDGDHFWNVSCVDDALNSNTSQTLTFNVNVTPNVTLTGPQADIWTNNQSISFYFNATDNDGFVLCELLFNGTTSSSSNTISSSAVNNITNSSVNEGIFNWTINCTDSGIYNNFFSPQSRTIKVDRTAPTITLLSPANESAESTTVNFNYTVTDNLADFFNCSLTLDGTNVSTDQLPNGGVVNVTQSNLAAGIHYWNVSCTDYAGNTVTSETLSFTIPLPDLTINSANITFNNSAPQEGTNITISANIFNIGNSSAENFTVQFWLGDPDTTGTQIGFNQTITLLLAGTFSTLNQSFNITIGTNIIYVVVDPPTGSGGFLSETNETNNKASNSIIVGFYNVFSGNTTTALQIADAVLVPVYTWNVSNTTGSNVLVADIDSSLSFTALQALGQDTTNSSAADDFSDLDTVFNAQNYTDNINATWTLAGSPKNTKSYNLFGRTIANVPIVNSTNSTTFTTGILWDTDDGGAQYDGTQDVIFITQINKSKQGFTGIYDYEAKVPALLRDYTGATSRVVFYTEIR